MAERTKKPQCLYYGNSQKAEILVPDQVYDWGGKRGQQNVLYATSIRDIALAYALGVVPDETGKYDRVLSYKLDTGEAVMIFHKGHPDFGRKGYLYELNPKGFKYTGGTQWVSPYQVKPIKVTVISVDDYLHLFRYATEEEKEHLEENFTEIR
jgi:hypothetical protein